MTLLTPIDAKLQRIAYEEAKAGYDEGACPIGSALAEGERIVAQGRNQRVQQGDPIAHGGRRFVSFRELFDRLALNRTTIPESNLRKVEHPTGEVVGTLNVREGQWVGVGEIVVRLDDTTTRANLGIVLNELTALRARLARLRAERDGLAEPVFPDDLIGRAAHEADIAQVLDGERTLFRTRASTKSGQRQQLVERIKQLKDEIAGLNEQMDALLKQLVIVRDEFKDLSDLHERGARPEAPHHLASAGDPRQGGAPSARSGLKWRSP